MRPLNFFSAASTGTFSSLKVAMMLLLEASMAGSPAAVATKAMARGTVVISSNELRLIGAPAGPRALWAARIRRGTPTVNSLGSRAPPRQHALERRIAVEIVVLQRRGR